MHPEKFLRIGPAIQRLAQTTSAVLATAPPLPSKFRVVFFSFVWQSLFVGGCAADSVYAARKVVALYIKSLITLACISVAHCDLLRDIDGVR